MDNMNFWREATSEEVKSIQFSILKYVRDFCIENNIRFFLMYGTLLGAVRHKGYIPWDDDVDICMLKDDYKKFVRIFNERQKQYKVYSRENDETFPYYFAKIVDTSTKLCEYVDGHDINLGINIDLFLLDAIPNDSQKRAKLFKKLSSIKKRMDLKSIDKRIKRVWYKKLGIEILSFLFRKKRAEYCWEIQRAVEKYQESDAKNVYEMMSPYGLRSILSLDFFENTAQLEFEGEMFPAPIEYKAVLQALYGDYMTPPPKDKQVTHHSYKAYLKGNQK